MSREDLRNLLQDDEEVIFLEGPEFDQAIVGLVERFGGVRSVCYDYGKVIRVLRKQGMSAEDASEYFDFNIIGAYVGENTPVYLTT
jgi:hypothetical protein